VKMAAWKRLILGFALSVAASISHATVVTWNLQNVAFDDGGTASGFFTIDTATGNAADFDVKTTAGTTITSAFEYSPANAQFAEASTSGGTFAVIHTPNQPLPQHAFELLLDKDLLTTTSGTVQIVQGPSSAEIVLLGDGTRLIRSMNDGGSITAVPEPSIFVLLVAMMLGLPLLRLRIAPRARVIGRFLRKM